MIPHTGLDCALASPPLSAALLWVSALTPHGDAAPLRRKGSFGVKLGDVGWKRHGSWTRHPVPGWIFFFFLQRSLGFSSQKQSRAFFRHLQHVFGGKQCMITASSPEIQTHNSLDEWICFTFGSGVESICDIIGVFWPLVHWRLLIQSVYPLLVLVTMQPMTVLMSFNPFTGCVSAQLHAKAVLMVNVCCYTFSQASISIHQVAFVV